NKRITSILLDGSDFVNLDNVNDHLDSGSLASAFTAYPTFKGRLLGHSRMVTPPVRCVWCVTANNPAMSVELSRRLNLIRLVANTETPWKGRNFKHPDLIRWATENRGKLVWAAFTLVQNWIAKGKPEGLARIGSFESWSATMGGILGAAGVTGFLGNQG